MSGLAQINFKLADVTLALKHALAIKTDRQTEQSNNPAISHERGKRHMKKKYCL